MCASQGAGLNFVDLKAMKKLCPICKELAIKGQRFYAPSKVACHPATVSQTSRRPETPGSQMKDFITPSRASTYVLSTSSQALEGAAHVVDSIPTH